MPSWKSEALVCIVPTALEVTIYYGRDELGSLQHKQNAFYKCFWILSLHEIGCQTKLIHQRFKDMRATWWHVMIIIYTANEHAQFCGIARLIHVEYGINVPFSKV